MRRFGLLLALFAIQAVPPPAHAADPRYPDWPCAQAKVPQLSVAAMWDGPSIADVGNSWQDDPKIKDLVMRLAARRTPLDAAQKAAADFITGDKKEKTEKEDKAKKLFAGLFDTLSQERSEVMDGIERLEHNEKGLADRIRSDAATLRGLQDEPAPDQAKMDQLAGQVEWGTRIFEDRRKSIRYVCEVPTIIEQRVFALGRAIRQTLN